MDRSLLRVTALCIYTFLLSSFLHAQDLSLSQNDLRIELWPDGGYHLFIRYKPDISSVLITETTKDPQFRADNYAYRTGEWNVVNGDEIRLIDGYPIPKENRIYSLVSSTPKWHSDLGWAYHIYLPRILYFGYEGGRHGEIRVGDGTYLNIRTFYYAYADYRGPFRDNPFMLRLAKDTPSNTIKGTYLRDTVAGFTAIAGENTVYSGGPSDLVEKIRDILKKEKDKNVDIVICLDTTGSMKLHIDAMRLHLTRTLREIISEFASFRIGMVLYKDYYEEYLNKIIPFTGDFDVFQGNLNAVKADGGGDIPEAVYEALYAGAVDIPWAAPSKIMILIGDAPPHSRPRSRITKQMVDRELASRGIQMHAIILPELK